MGRNRKEIFGQTKEYQLVATHQRAMHYDRPMRIKSDFREFVCYKIIKTSISHLDFWLIYQCMKWKIVLSFFNHKDDIDLSWSYWYPPNKLEMYTLELNSNVLVQHFSYIWFVFLFADTLVLMGWRKKVPNRSQFFFGVKPSSRIVLYNYVIKIFFIRSNEYGRKGPH